VIRGEADTDWGRKAVAGVTVEDRYWRTYKITVFCVVAVALVGLFGIWVLLVGVGSALGDRLLCMAGVGHHVE